MQCYTFIFMLGLGMKCTHSFWPPAYKIDLRDKKTFVIETDDEGYDDESENEMIQPQDLVEIESLEEDEQKYKPLHSHVERYNQRTIQTATEYSEILPRSQFNLEDTHNFVNEVKPFIAGFKHDLDEYNFEESKQKLEVVRKKRNITGTSWLILNETEQFDKLSNASKAFNFSVLNITDDVTKILDTNYMHTVESNNWKEIKRRDKSDNNENTTISATAFLYKLSKNKNEKFAKSKGISIKASTDRHKFRRQLPNVNENLEKINKRNTVTQMYTSNEEENTGNIQQEIIKLLNKGVNENVEENPNLLQKNASLDSLLIDETKSTISPNINTLEEEEYDYERFKEEYYQQIEDSKNSNNTFNYTDNGELEETAQDALKKIVELKKPKNCTKEELTEFGIKAFECLAFDYQHANNKTSVKKVLSRAWRIIRVWICIYVGIAIPCWCQKGWCCCCFRCKFCDPNQRILIVKEYYVDNPPGILVHQPTEIEGQSDTTKYEPTLFELEAYEKLETAIRNL